MSWSVHFSEIIFLQRTNKTYAYAFIKYVTFLWILLTLYLQNAFYFYM